VKLPFFTIGHSNRSLEEFVELLSGARVDRVVDIRKVPRSRSNPQFDKDTLPEALTAFGVSYEHVAALGGLRGKARSVPPDANGFWTNESFHNYADYALSAQFHAGLRHLLDEGRKRRCAIMCSEAVWWRCHRRIVADYLIVGGASVFHIMGRGRLVPARLTPGAAIRPGGTVVYPAANRSDACLRGREALPKARCRCHG
jgi:uncharacterized protein (DUF488 family)